MRIFISDALHASLFQTVADHCPQLTSINLSDCGRVGFEGIKGLVDKCAKLTSFDLSSMQVRVFSISHVQWDLPISMEVKILSRRIQTELTTGSVEHGKIHACSFGQSLR